MATDLSNWQGAADSQLDFGKNAYLEAIPDLAAANATAKGASGLQGEMARTMGKQSLGLYGRMGKFEGMQDQYAADAAGHNSAARQEQVSGEAVAGVARQFGSLQDQTARTLTRSGVNPGSGKALALGNQMQYAQAGAQAGAASKARNDLEMRADDRQKTAIGFGANLPTQAAQAAQTGALVANAAVSTASAPLSNRMSFANGMRGVYGSAVDDYKGLYTAQNLTPGQQAIINGQDAANQRADDQAFWSTMGSAANSQAGQDAINSGVDWLFS